MVLSDRTIREQLAAGRIVIDPLVDANIQPSSVDLTVSNLFRVFRNHTAPVIDVKEDQEDLTELVEVEEGQAFILHPGEFVLGSTAERVSLPDDLVARLEGKSSLGRLGLLIHSSLPASEEVLVLDEDGALRPRPIGEIVAKQRRGQVVSFDPETFEVGFAEITGWYEGPADRIFEVRLRSGRSVRVTAGHNLFTLDRDGRVEKVRTGALRPGTRVAIPGAIPDPTDEVRPIRVLDLVPESMYSSLIVTGPAVGALWEARALELTEALAAIGIGHAGYYRKRNVLPLAVAAAEPGYLASVSRWDAVLVRSGSAPLPCVITPDVETAWLLGIYVAEGSKRRNQVVISNTVPAILDRAAAAAAGIGLPTSRTGANLTIMGGVLPHLIDWLGGGGKAFEKRIPHVVWDWPTPLLESFLRGIVDGDGSDEETRTSVWTSCPQLADDVLLLFTRLGRRAARTWKDSGHRGLFQVDAPHREHTLLTAVPLPEQLLIELRERTGLLPVDATFAAGYGGPTDLNNIERRFGRDAVSRQTLARLLEVYRDADDGRLERLVQGDLRWDEVVEVVDTEVDEAIYDIEVRPEGRKIENFVAGSGGVFVSNTAGFIDPGFDGQVTLELSNVANLPITIYPGMKIGQISFLTMTTPAERPYGSSGMGSKYQGQRGPRPSRYFENFVDAEGSS